MSSTDDREAGKRCTCGEFPNRDPRCPVHGVGLYLKPDRPDAIPDAAKQAIAEAVADKRMASWDHLTDAELRKCRPREVERARPLVDVVLAALLPFLPARAPEGMVLLADVVAALRHAGSICPNDGKAGGLMEAARYLEARFGAPSEGE